MQIIYLAIALFLGIIGGIVFGYQLRKMWAVKRKDTIETKVENLINEAKAKQKEILLGANDRALKIIEEAKQEEKERQQELGRLQKRLESREALFDQKLLDLENKKQELLEKAEKVEKLKAEIGKIREEQLAKLEKVANLTKEEAKKVLLDNVEREIKEDLLLRIKKLNSVAAEELDKKAKEMLSLAIQRCAVSHATESTTTVIDLPSDEMKGRIIGREGRNIRTIERLTGTEIIVDDTPQAITVSGFSPIRRQVAKRALDKLILDGRIHPVKIEEAIENAKKEIAVEIKEAGENAVYELGITGIDPKLVQVLGRLKYRTSYGQNILQHSLEIAHLSAMLAQELGADVTIAKKGGLFHDIGKAVDHEVQGTHPEIGYDILKKFGLSEEIAYIARGHHDDAPKTLEAVIVKVADAISGARPGARKDTYEQYLQRLQDLEKVAATFAGVDKAYAIQAGREIRIFVMPDEIDDLAAIKLAKEIAKKIEDELKYPGEIKVTVIREKRIIEYAR
ncbi:MAG: ribonuclease Y [Candidatus Buchananbacteria bacterium RIFCSPHIGHO2_02_FULL_45_11b]|uniref:Ribonuclease Y n=4 Tax=Candidatus Buchananiibacteriota TaxID=1817903 RepID=A0A1G1YHZ2_9BACT|nr:MAG: ribonuclease Y [Candidatus Buchananbacteria bacterium RIFCSPHIGHO2_01_FULL_46_12]OGY51077.1 MAG: ribonuclease Y [Candidatus Buchananbacteria bacterium RIFCSPHIGHO2_02_FULL_45_11b]OGY54406.1 MAG: ribonuclease Y [Candidatus Buchananbacteria bacterium RIFCSPLOWO2_01_FULL_45_31]OGY57705.1 MAG: ribonuclease Y [Candidatus Buchananbacteria bacterium RIFCSPLOWO2_02_FULL_46_11b]